MHVGSVDKLAATQSGSPLQIHGKNFLNVTFVIPKEKESQDIYSSLTRLSQPGSYVSSILSALSLICIFPPNTCWIWLLRCRWAFCLILQEIAGVFSADTFWSLSLCYVHIATVTVSSQVFNSCTPVWQTAGLKIITCIIVGCWIITVRDVRYFDHNVTDISSRGLPVQTSYLLASVSFMSRKTTTNWLALACDMILHWWRPESCPFLYCWTQLIQSLFKRIVNNKITCTQVVSSRED